MEISIPELLKYKDLKDVAWFTPLADLKAFLWREAMYFEEACVLALTDKTLVLGPGMLPRLEDFAFLVRLVTTKQVDVIQVHPDLFTNFKGGGDTEFSERNTLQYVMATACLGKAWFAPLLQHMELLDTVPRSTFNLNDPTGRQAFEHLQMFPQFSQSFEATTKAGVSDSIKALWARKGKDFFFDKSHSFSYEFTSIVKNITSEEDWRYLHARLCTVWQSRSPKLKYPYSPEFPSLLTALVDWPFNLHLAIPQLMAAQPQAYNDYAVQDNYAIIMSILRLTSQISPEQIKTFATYPWFDVEPKTRDLWFKCLLQSPFPIFTLTELHQFMGPELIPALHAAVKYNKRYDTKYLSLPPEELLVIQEAVSSVISFEMDDPAAIQFAITQQLQKVLQPYGVTAVASAAPTDTFCL